MMWPAPLASAVPVAPTMAPPGAPFSAIYAFGDSLTDGGNDSLATAGLVPVSPPYADRSFTNGQVWVKDLAQDLGLPALNPSLAGGTDFAYGGAETGQTPAHTLNPDGSFVADLAVCLAGAVAAGRCAVRGVDRFERRAGYRQQHVADAGTAAGRRGAAVNNETAAISALAARGAKNLLVLNVPDLGKTPYEMARGPTVAQSATSLASLYNSELAASVQQLEASGALKIDLVDTFSVIDQVIANPAAHGFTNVTDPVWTGNLTDPEQRDAAMRPARRRTSSCSSTRCIRQPRRMRCWHPAIAQGLTGVA